MNYCRFCGKPVSPEAELCTHCGRRLKEPPRQVYTNPEHEYSKTGVGVAMALFLGIIGLIIGICMYPSGTTARETFIKAWVTTFIIGMLVVVLIVIFGTSCIVSMLDSYYY